MNPLDSLKNIDKVIEKVEEELEDPKKESTKPIKEEIIKQPEKSESEIQKKEDHLYPSIPPSQIVSSNKGEEDKTNLHKMEVKEENESNKLYPSIPASQIGSSNNVDNIFNPDLMGSSSENDNNSSSIKKSITTEELKNDKSVLSKKSGSFQKDQYIQPTDWKIMNDSYIAELEAQIYQFAKSINKQQYTNLRNSVQKCKLEVVHQNPGKFYNVGPLSTLEYMVESTFFYDQSFKSQMLLQVIELEDFIYRWRSIQGDGNCFYRACIFSFLENIVLTKNIMLLKEFIIDFDQKIKDDYKNVRCYPFIKKKINSLDKPLICQILYLLLTSLDEGSSMGMTPYEILVKSFNFCRPFDLGMIFYFRFLLYEFIKDNWNKAYTTEFSVKIGNLLPAEYETEIGEFLYEKFYEEQLLQMGTDAEKIVIYLTPFVLKCDLNIIMYEFDQEDSVFAREFKCGLDKPFRIELLFRKTHYDIIYNRTYFNNFQRDFCSYVNVNENVRVIDIDSLNHVRELKNKNNKIKENLGIEVVKAELKTSIELNKPGERAPTCSSCKQTYTSKENVFCLCDKCLLSELKSQIFGNYLVYLGEALQQYTKRRTNLPKYFKNFFKNKNCAISNQQVPLELTANIAGTSIISLLNEIKAKMCLLCQETIDNDKYFYKLPCSCILCSKKCFQQYFGFFLVEDLKIQAENEIYYPVFSFCLCGYQYGADDYKKYYEDFTKNKLTEYKKSLKEVILNSWKDRCMCCLLEYNREIPFFSVILKDKKIYEFYQIKEIKHIICQDCAQKVKNEKEIECAICNMCHIKEKIKKITDKDDACLIF